MDWFADRWDRLFYEHLTGLPAPRGRGPGIHVGNQAALLAFGRGGLRPVRVALPSNRIIREAGGVPVETTGVRVEGGERIW